LKHQKTNPFPDILLVDWLEFQFPRFDLGLFKFNPGRGCPTRFDWGGEKSLWGLTLDPIFIPSFKKQSVTD
jgi:hypothetical protein